MASTSQFYKKCSCGIEYTKLPDDNKFVHYNDPMDGIYFNCTCGSTCFIPIAKIKFE